MSFIRLLALSYLAWAAVFVVAVILVAHLPLARNAVGGTSAPAARTATVSPPPAARKVARLELAPVPPIPNPPATDDVTSPKPPVAQPAESKPEPSKPSPPAAVVAKPILPQRPTARPEPRAVARLDLVPAPVPVPRPHGDVLPSKPRVVHEPQHKLALTEKPQPRPVAAPPAAPAQARGPTHLASAKPAFQIPDPPPSSLSNLPVHLQPTASQNRKRAAGEPAFHIPDPPPLEAPRL